MDSGQAKKDPKTQRVFLRIPFKARVKTFYQGKLFKNLVSQDLSASGIALNTSGENFDFDSIEILFKTSLFAPAIKTKVKIKNKIKSGKGLRLGCIFENIKDRDRELIAKFIAKFCDYLAPAGKINLTGFICLLDFLLRLSLCFILGYYLLVELQSGFSFILGEIPKVMSIFLYSLLSLLAFIFSDRYFILKGVKYLNFSFVCLGLCLLFVVYNCLKYWFLGLGFSDIFAARLVCYLYTAFCLSALASFIGTAGLLNKVKIVMDSERIHRSHI
ncbi:MAG: PilZ domain-containing protein [Candidatus Omnitrophica bacterium]|nr:PilZ domain-containing protein [Candidatus Omnitrophota bacterium]